MLLEGLSLLYSFAVHSAVIYATPTAHQLYYGCWGFYSEQLSKTLLQGEQIFPRGGKQGKGNEEVNKCNPFRI